MSLPPPSNVESGGFADADRYFAGRGYVVSGAASGIGKATAERLLELGATVLGVDLAYRERGPELGGAAKGGRLLTFGADISNPADRVLLRDKALALGPVAGLVNCAGRFVTPSDWHGSAEWSSVLGTNLLGPAELCRLLADDLAAAGGAIVNVASISGYIAQPGLAPYNASKAGLIALTRSLALLLGRRGVRVNSVSPGWVWTRPNQLATNNDRDAWERRVAPYTCLGRGGDSSEIANVICFLLSPLASYVHGTDVAVDGGYLCLGPEGPGS